MNLVLDTLHTDWQSFLRFAPRLAYGLIVFVIFLVVAKWSGRLVERLLRRSKNYRSHISFLRRITSWGVGSVGIMLALSIMGFKGIATSMLATGGVAAIVLGFAFKEIGENFLAGFFLTFSRPFEIGDLVKTGDLTGVVKSIELRFVHIRTYDACDVFVPSAQIFREALFNYTRDGLRRPKFSIGVAYHDNPTDIIDLLEKATCTTPGVLTEPQAFVSIQEFTSQYVQYEVFFWLDETQSGPGYVPICNSVKAACWQALGDAGMTFSTDVTSGLEVKSVPPLAVAVQDSISKHPPRT